MRFSTKENLTKEEHIYLKFAAYSALIDFGEHVLPVLADFSQIINSSIYILPMQLISQKLGYEGNCFSEAGDGLAVYITETGHYIILFDEQSSSPDIRWTIARLFYLVWTGRLKDQPDVFHYTDNIEDTARCDIFAYYFTCPDIILKECSISNASDIIEYCGIPFSNADIKSRLLSTAADSKSLQLIEEILKTDFASDIERIRHMKKT